MQQCFADQIDLLNQPDQTEWPKPIIAVYVHEPLKVRHQIESREMCFRGSKGEAAWIHCVQMRYRGQP
jgi:hypothetical protein